MLVQLVNTLLRAGSRKKCRFQLFSDFRNRARDAEERTASERLFQTEVAAAEKALSPIVARTVHEMTSAVDDEERSRRCVQTSETRCSCLYR